MIFVYMSILVMVLIITSRVYGTIIKPNIVLTVPWCIFAGLSTLGINNLRTPSLKTHLYILTFILFFNLMYFLFSQKRFKIDILTEDINYQFRYKLIYFSNIISWIFMIPIILNAYHIISNYGFLAIRSYAFVSSDVLVGGFDKFIAQTIIRGIFQATVLLAMINIAFKKKTPFLTVCAIINVIIYTFVFGGRFQILQLIMYYLFAHMFSKKIIVNKELKRKMSYGLIAILISTMVYVTLKRGSDNFIYSLISYYAGPFSFLDYILNNPETFDLNNYLWGAATLGFITEPITLILKLLFRLDIHIASYYINICTQPFYEIGPGRYFNALTTVIYPFIRDFGYFGIIVGSVFLAGFSGLLEKAFLKKKKIVYFCLYIHLIYIIFNSILAYSLLSYPSVMVLFFIILFSTGKQKNYKSLRRS
ncbi:O-antigen polymerase [Alkalibacter saccharofermentans]|uniref:Oligosaccharide repeat unit polymerase n=1 Tax=Alkalibacter saccharofermentans DSM 14828 TaxID=1120975 RepID=A0A1M4ZVH9_9FIRM|nr:O-antigen polymerase [Alkalibacter saccharofermentans]SHF22063.1 oligosaccharide repeat unit polymerase [Alkalibacter saccharofermentans DSM 14828]